MVAIKLTNYSSAKQSMSKNWLNFLNRKGRITWTTGVSDHRVQIVDFNFPICKRNPGVMWVRSFRKCD